LPDVKRNCKVGSCERKEGTLEKEWWSDKRGPLYETQWGRAAEFAIRTT